MAKAHQRKKQPEQVRRALLDCVAQIAIEQGLGALTIQAVAERAGVTKGGLLHHFDSKQALIEAVFADLLEKLDRQIDQAIEVDPEPRGSFTRGYIRACFADRTHGTQNLWAALSVATLSEPALRALWSAWLDARLARHHATDDTPTLTIARLAADGVWLADMLEKEAGLQRYPLELEAQLLAIASAATSDD
jgi:AcrR family transcriptional regulator